MPAQFLIGQYGGFDLGKYERDFRSHFFGIENCLYESEEDFDRLLSLSNKDGFKYGFHFAPRAGQHEFRDALFMSSDENTREEAFRFIEQELEYLCDKHLKPEYVLFHYPKPVRLDPQKEWDLWYFDNEAEYEWENEHSQISFERSSEEIFQRLSSYGEQYGFTPVLEFDAVPSVIVDTDLLIRLLEKYPCIRICLDTARLFLQTLTDPEFDAIKVIRKYASYAKLIHLSNARYTDHHVLRHHPVLPKLSPDDGWAPIEDYLRTIQKLNSDILILFEHRSDRITDAELAECYEWVDGIMNREKTSITNQ
ncbi:TIM barrel protein [Paenibacillus sp. 453mf]|uniref:sugar phosphate isomerase/epimerase family protein n=1 Tax=Paenibacillus sp. 453mf TaxID=1761874 RepID=UPI0008F2E5E0|nr:TIM barrel protein [Paenibacillus sp. 453mf]SFS57673.1 Sugar phosphate isomerase/epimerase [Paenibacillus sp. 453mf]